MDNLTTTPLLEKEEKEEEEGQQENTILVRAEYLEDKATTIDSDNIWDIPFEFYPKVYQDDRGAFVETLPCCYSSKTRKNENSPTNKVLNNFFSKVAQVNYSVSKPGTIRGFHAQLGDEYAQGKLVENVTPGTIAYSIIVDARPKSKEFGTYTIFRLNGDLLNSVWIPRGFLHALVIPAYKYDSTLDLIVKNTESVGIQYYVDNIYNKEASVSVTPVAALKNIIANQIQETSQEIEKETSQDKAIQPTKLKLQELLTIEKTLNEDTLYISEKDKNGYDFLKFLMSLNEEFANEITTYMQKLDQKEKNKKEEEKKEKENT